MAFLLNCLFLCSESLFGDLLFVYRNQDFFNALHALGLKLISAMPNEKRGLNGQHFLDTELLHWLLVNAEVHFTIPEKKKGCIAQKQSEGASEEARKSRFRFLGRTRTQRRRRVYTARGNHSLR